MSPPDWYTIRGGYRVVTPEAGSEASSAIEYADEASLHPRWPGIVVMKSPRGWAWRTIADSPYTDGEILRMASSQEEWAIYRAPVSVEDYIRAREAEELQAAQEEEQRKLREAARAKREAEEKRAFIIKAAAGTALACFVGWKVVQELRSNAKSIRQDGER